MDLTKLHHLLTIDSPSGMEESMIEYLRTFKTSNFKIVNKLSSDYNLTYFLDNKSKKTLLIDAHVDEIGSRVKSITSNGFLLVKPFGCDSKNLFGRPAKIYSSKQNKILPGVFMIDPVHLRKSRKKLGDVINPELLYVDVGFKNKLEAEKYITVGDFILPEYPIFEMGINNQLLTSKALDNTIGTFILLELFLFFDKYSNKSKYNLIFNFSSGEEIGNASYLGFDKIGGISKIDKMIIIDTIFALDTPFINQEIHGNITLGKGPVLEIGGANRGLYKELSALAKREKIPYQNYLSGAGGSNLTYFAKYNSMTQFIGVPARNLHSPVETVHLDDITITYKLLKKFIQL
jgi:putative aminopeptidase FrvX